MNVGNEKMTVIGLKNWHKMSIREQAKTHNIEIKGKLKRVKNNTIYTDMRIYNDEEDNEFWQIEDGSYVYVDHDGGCM